MIEIRHLRTLAALAESGSLSQAAKRLHLTQSALSHQLRGLESHYATPVVKRNGQTVELTEAGQRLLLLARSVLSNIQSTERDLARLANVPSGTLRIALECHTCFDWLMPVMDTFRKNWPEVELDLVSGFHPDPAELLRQDRADLVIGSDNKRRTGIVNHPLFRFEILACLAVDHRLASKKFLSAKDFTGETLITYPVPAERIDVIRQVLRPARVKFERRTAELTIAILQLVASRRGVSALPNWGIKNYVDYDYVSVRRIGSSGLWSDLYATMTREMAQKPYALDFIETIKTTCFANLTGLVALR